MFCMYKISLVKKLRIFYIHLKSESSVSALAMEGHLSAPRKEPFPCIYINGYIYFEYRRMIMDRRMTNDTF